MNKKTVFVSFALGLIAIVLFVLLSKEKEYSGNLEIENNRLEAFVSELLDKNDQLTNEKDIELKQVQNELLNAQSAYDVLSKEKILLQEKIVALELPDYFTLQFLKEKGISDYHLLEEDLREKGPEIIGYEGVLGGTMFFGDVRILSPRWAYAEFEDGHIAGYGIYEYAISNENEISWTILSEFILD